MGTPFKIEHRIENNDLHLKPRGDLDGSTAWQIINLVGDFDDGRRRIFIDTCRLENVFPFGRNVFRCRLRLKVSNLGRVHFKGERGREMAPAGCRVVAVGAKAGGGKKCACAHEGRIPD